MSDGELKKTLDTIQDEIMKSREIAIQHNSANTSSLLKEINNMKKWQENHEIDDNKRFESMNEFIGKMEPFLKVLEDKKIDKMVIDRKTKTLYIYAKEWGTILLFLGSAWAFIKFFLLKVLIP